MELKSLPVGKQYIHLLGLEVLIWVSCIRKHLWIMEAPLLAQLKHVN